MSRRPIAVRFLAVIMVVVASGAYGHTLFLKPESFRVPVGQQVVIPLLNGTFLENENKVTVARFSDAQMVSPDGSKISIEEKQWVIDDSNLTSLVTSFVEPGNYVVAVGTKPMLARIAAADFSFYLKYEGLFDDLEERRRLDEQEIAAAERYSKFAKAIIQAGDVQSDNFDEVVGHPIEIVPLTNPFDIETGDSLVVRVLRDSKPLAGELVYASGDKDYVKNAEGIFEESVAVRTDEDGLAEIPIQSPGRWFVRAIDLSRTGDSEHWYSDILVALGVEEPRVAYESFWATLTFEVR